MDIKCKMKNLALISYCDYITKINYIQISIIEKMREQQ